MVEQAEAFPVPPPICSSPLPELPAHPSLSVRAIARVRTLPRAGAIPGAQLAVSAALGTRLLVWAASIATIAIFGENTIARHVLDPSGVTTPMHSAALNALLAPAARWDSVWYLLIASHGYFSAASANFFPLYPMLVKLATPMFGDPLLAGTAISLVAMIGALMLLYRLALLDLDEPAARMTVLLVAVFPSSLFLSAVYPTSLFLMLILGATYAARRERWAVAGLCGGLAAATRSNGILVVGLLALLYLYGPRGRAPRSDLPTAWWRPRFRVERNIAWLALVPGGLAVYLAYLWAAHGAPLAPYSAAHLYWAHSFGPPLGAIIKALGDMPVDVRAVIGRTTTSIGPGDPLSWQSRNLIDLLFLSVAASALVVGWNRVPRTYLIFGLLQLVQVTSFPTSREPMIGLSRYMLEMFPLFMAAGAYLAHRRGAARLTLGISTALLVVFSGLWAYWALVP